MTSSTEGRTLVLNEDNSYVTWRAMPADPTPPVFSGGALLSNLEWTPATDLQHRMGMAADGTVAAAGVMVAPLPAGVNASAIDSLFALPAAGVDRQTRLVRARYPNGNSEEDRMPTNYDKLAGGVSAFEEWKLAGNQSKRIAGFSRNASFYPWFGHSHDLRWVLDYHTENQSSIYSPGRQFWQAEIGTAAHYNATTFSKNVGRWTNVGDAVLHVIHYDWWGNWQWQLKEVDVAASTFKFGEGGWQDAHGGPVASNYFYAENVLEELDVPGEWYVDKSERKLYYWPKTTDRLAEMSFAASQLSSIVELRPSEPATGTGSKFVRGVTFDGVTFAHSATTYLAEKYAVPSAGDWSVLPSGAVTLSSGVIGVSEAPTPFCTCLDCADALRVRVLRRWGNTVELQLNSSQLFLLLLIGALLMTSSHRQHCRTAVGFKSGGTRWRLMATFTARPSSTATSSRLAIQGWYPLGSCRNLPRTTAPGLQAFPPTTPLHGATLAAQVCTASKRLRCLLPFRNRSILQTTCFTMGQGLVNELNTPTPQ